MLLFHDVIIINYLNFDNILSDEKTLENTWCKKLYVLFLIK